MASARELETVEIADEHRALVVVVDHRGGEAFLLDVHKNDNALEMFEHPYAYAARRRIDHELAARGQGPPTRLGCGRPAERAPSRSRSPDGRGAVL
jgi:hypothetical protein